MSTTITLDEALINLRDIIRNLHPGDEVLIIEGQKEVAKIVVPSPSTVQTNPRQPGLGRGSIIFMSPDFDEPIDDFSTETE